MHVFIATSLKLATRKSLYVLFKTTLKNLTFTTDNDFRMEGVIIVDTTQIVQIT